MKFDNVGRREDRGKRRGEESRRVEVEKKGRKWLVGGRNKDTEKDTGISTYTIVQTLYTVPF
jgi:hypothetical protein